MTILENINSPSDLKKLAPEQLPQLATEVRQYIVDVVSTNGGHLAPSLGVVDLTLALHYVFDAPNDKIIWDVGHQSYAHKILTGRREQFKTIRKLGGLSGFTKREESIFDPFGAGHASTSISAALGIAKAFKRRELDNRAIAVIGDGSMTGGLAFEGLNHGGFRTGNLIVVLNDNKMSISPNVGALSKFFSMHLYSKRCVKIRRWFKNKLLTLLPKRGKDLWKLARKVEEVATGLFTPGFMFESFGFLYIGPLDGHNLTELTRVFRAIKETPVGESPILVHVITKKGRGYKPAEENPTKFHGTGPFDKETGETPPSTKQTYTQVAGGTVLELAKQDGNIAAITAAMSTGTGMEGVSKELPEQFHDVGIAEGHAVTFAAGLATEGFRPVVALYSTFMQRAYDHILHDVCLQNLPVTFAVDRAGLVGDDGPTHHGVFDLSYLRQMPNMVVMAPRDENMLKQMLFTAIYSGKPAAVRYPRGSVEGVTIEKNYRKIELGKMELMFGNLNSDIAIIAVGNCVWSAIEAARSLEKEGIKASVLDARFVKPLDEAMLGSLADKCKRWITVEENAIAGGFGSAVSEWLNENKANNISINILGLPDKFIEQGPQNILRARYGIDADGIILTIRQLLTQEKRSSRQESSSNKKASPGQRAETSVLE
ncbi:MAG: 1-deoxy-D-xylulose-5-phosphate synthase [Deltaproteobacteria bacterium CG11_big_fil_rev_8_21_14_0_20_49_13]|nr:MAG: 1-deoxy-D-xylulose-5-phosphate synthase [Deltaproteobacteria bacterium CG11_big_fil_rev_8_21_14_0_20_49_13]